MAKYKQRSDMEREIWEIIKALDEKKLTVIEAHKKLCGLYIVSKCYTEKDMDNAYDKGFKDGNQRAIKAF